MTPQFVFDEMPLPVPEGAAAAAARLPRVPIYDSDSVGVNQHNPSRRNSVPTTAGPQSPPAAVNPAASNDKVLRCAVNCLCSRQYKYVVVRLSLSTSSSTKVTPVPEYSKIARAV